MAVPEQIPVVNYVADGIVKKFDVPFEYDQQSDLHVYVDGVESTIDKYFFADNSFNFYIAPTVGQAVKIKRITPKERDTDYNLHTNTVRPKALNTDFDHLWYVLQEVFSDVGGLSQTVQDEIIARIQGDEDLLNQLTAEISARMLGDEAVTEDLKNYVNQVIGAIINDPDFDGIDADKVNDASGETQQQVNYNGGSKWHSRVGGYKLNERVVLANGNIVKSIIDRNTNDPNVNMAGWVKTNSASQIFDESGKTQQEINNYTARKLDENYSITDFIIIGENYTDANFDWSPVYERAIQHILSKGGGRLNTPHKGTPYALNGILRTDGQIVGIEIPFTGGSDFGATATKVDFVCESQAVKFIPLQDDMIVFRHASSYCEVGKFQIHHNGKLRCTGFALTPQNWISPASASQQSHNHIHDIYTYGMLEGFIYQSGGSGGCYYNTAVNCYAVGTTAQGGRGLVLKAGIKSTGQATRASPPNRNRFYNFKAFSTNVAIDIQSGDTNYFYGLSSENNTRAGQFSAIPTALKIANLDSEGHAIQGNTFFGLSVEGATKDAEILSNKTAIYGHTLTASKTTLSPTFVSGKSGTIVGCFDATVFPDISGGVINNIGGILPEGLPSYETGKTDTQISGIHDVDGRFKSYALSLDKFTGVEAVSNSVSYASKYNNRVDFECRFNFRPLTTVSTIQVALPFEANFNLYASLTTHAQSFAFPVYIQYGAASNRQIAFARVVSLNGTTATHLEVQAPAAGWNTASDGQYNVIHAQLNYRAK